MSAYDDIAQGLDEIHRSAFVSGSTKGSYKQKYRPEYDRVKAYLDGGTFPSPYPTTLMGSGLTKVERGRRALVPEPPPPPPNGLPARSTNVLRRYTRVHSSQFTAGRNTYVPPAGFNSSWWQPPEKVGTPWRGNIVGQINIPTPHGEGIRFNALDEMAFLGVSDNRMCSLEIQGNFPQWEGQKQQYDGYILLPGVNAGKFGGGFWEGHCIAQIGGTTGGGPDTNGHKLWIRDSGKLAFSIRHDDSQWADRLFESAQPLALDVWHHVRWEIHVTEGNDGFHRGWLNGTQIMDYTGPTIWAGEVIWEQMIGWYSTRTGNDNVIEFSEWQLGLL